LAHAWGAAEAWRMWGGTYHRGFGRSNNAVGAPSRSADASAPCDWPPWGVDLSPRHRWPPESDTICRILTLAWPPARWACARWSIPIFRPDWALR